MTQVGYSAFGWSEELVGGQQPKAACYQLNSFFGEPIDTCRSLLSELRAKVSLSVFIVCMVYVGLYILWAVREVAKRFFIRSKLL